MQMIDPKQIETPYAPEAEIAVIGGLLLEPARLDAVLEIAGEEEFYREAHRRLLAAMARLRDRGEVTDIVTLSEELRTAGDMAAVGGVAYLAQVSDRVPSAANIEYHARLVAEKAHLRRLIAIGSDIQTEARGNRTADEVQELAERLVFAAAREKASSGIAHIREPLWQVFEEMEAGHQGLLTGFRSVDELITGFEPGELVIVAARPAMGKTSFAMQMATNVALREQRPVLIFSHEMTKKALARRMLLTEARVDGIRLRRHGAREDDYARLGQAAGYLNTAPIFIEDKGAKTVRSMRGMVRRAFTDHAEKPPALIVVDYLQKMHGEGETRNLEIQEISGGLKDIAMEFGVPVVALSQLSRRVEERTDKRPMMSDLRDGGSIEQDADVVMFLYRAEYYHGNSAKTGRGDAERMNVEGLAEVIVGKVRNGATGTVMMAFEKEYTRFEELNHGHGGHA